MATIFGATSTTEDVLSGIDLRGKRILVTGVSAGLGVETSRSLAAHGAQVVGAARDLAKAETATAQIRKDAAAVGGRLELVALDLADLKSVHRPYGGQFGTNHLGHFVFVNRIAPLIRAAGRLINLSSAGHRFSNVDLDDPNFERTLYDPFVCYGRSQTANILFAVAFDRRDAQRQYNKPSSRLRMIARWILSERASKNDNNPTLRLTETEQSLTAKAADIVPIGMSPVARRHNHFIPGLRQGD